MIYDAVHCQWELWLTQRRATDETDNQPVDVQQHGRRVARPTRPTACRGPSTTRSARDLAWIGRPSRRGARPAHRRRRRRERHRPADALRRLRRPERADRLRAAARAPAAPRPACSTLNVATRDLPCQLPQRRRSATSTPARDEARARRGSVAIARATARTRPR